MPRITPRTAATADPPVAAAKHWVLDRDFPPDRPLLDVSQAVPGYPPAAELRAHLAVVVERVDSAAYAPAVGLPHVRAAIARRTALAAGARDAIGADQVAVTAGCNQAFCLAIDALTQPGDEVILPVPYYFNHDMWLRARGVRAISLAVDATTMVPDPTVAAALVTDRTRAIVLVTPNNPVGVEYPPSTIDAFGELASEHGIALVLDETYHDFRAADGPAHHLFARADWPEFLVQVSSFSKVFSLAGYRVGSLVASADFVAQVAKLADCMTICAPRVAQEAVAFAIEHLDGWTSERRVEMLARVERCREALAPAPGGFALLAAGAFFAYVRHPFDTLDSTTVARALVDHAHVLTIPGACFGPDQEHALRLAFGNIDADALPELAHRFAQMEDPR
ncbi:MAG TPA: aminotransferase [Acidimicrobiia bacterium]|nr:aminotransferase [Acidimicrobiia bacterium]